eukprot:7140774-Ditylum_brightwellii.AAC.1
MISATCTFDANGGNTGGGGLVGRLKSAPASWGSSAFLGMCGWVNNAVALSMLVYNMMAFSCFQCLVLDFLAASAKTTSA